MKRIIYGVGFFLAVLFLCAGFLLSYQVASLKERILSLEESSAKAEQKVSAIADTRNQDFVFQRYQDGKLQEEFYRITSYSADKIVLRQEKDSQEAAENKEFLLKTEDGYVVVYRNNGTEVFEHTNILVETLPVELQKEILMGKEIENADILYSFLENYSS